jgi:hypothetical protein
MNLLMQVWMRCELTGYCNDARIYLGKHDDMRSKQLGERVVKHLCRSLKGKNHHVYFDRFVKLCAEHYIMLLLLAPVQVLKKVARYDRPSDQFWSADDHKL